MPTDIAVDVEVSYSTGDGRVSPWSDTVTVSTSTASLAPSPNTAFIANGGAGVVTGGWSNSVSTNFGHSELWAGPTSVFAAATQLGADYTGARGVGETFSEAVSPGNLFLWTVAYNSGGTASSRTGPIQVTIT
ncbi:hypothetical protein [Novosphingobium sp. PhB165]|uniref:hypothetical protein n=1 Tax=Novosphingobium sp. PhB165 TaxID=2485105 RepID=UPI001050D0A5|nr:hypothetical protein [Novosphingobium sp. PhB165]